MGSRQKELARPAASTRASDGEPTAARSSQLFQLVPSSPSPAPAHRARPKEPLLAGRPASARGGARGGALARRPARAGLHPLHNAWFWTGAEVRKSSRSQTLLQNECILATFGFDTAEKFPYCLPKHSRLLRTARSRSAPRLPNHPEKIFWIITVGRKEQREVWRPPRRLRRSGPRKRRRSGRSSQRSGGIREQQRVSN